MKVIVNIVGVPGVTQSSKTLKLQYHIHPERGNLSVKVKNSGWTITLCHVEIVKFTSI